jgi:hypothetical protein
MNSLIEHLLLDCSEKDYLKTQLLISSIDEQFDSINDFIKKSISHIINAHHILNARLRLKNPESELWDQLPLNFLGKLHFDNYITTRNIIEDFFVNSAISDEQIYIFFNHLNSLYEHANYHRSQIVYVMKLSELKTPDFNMMLIQ